MKSFLRSLPLLLATLAWSQTTDAERQANTVVLDAAGVKNLRIQTAAVEETAFEETAFALGRIEAKPGNVAAVSSRIEGRVVNLSAMPGNRVEQGAEVARVESRQPGNPPPTVGLTAPLGGLVTSLGVRLGDPVQPDRALLEITDLSEVYAIARVPEHVAGRLGETTTAHIAVAALPDAKFEGKLLRLGTAADPASGTIDAVFVLPKADTRLRPGMRAEFSIVLSKRGGVTSVPRSAVQGEGAQRFVYVKDFDLPNAFVKTPVVVGAINDRFAEIVSGLLPADEVVIQGAYSLAFAGGGNVSLKEALDAAHGHAHAADGSELKSDTPANSSASASDGHAHDENETHREGGGGNRSSLLWMIVSGVLFVALLIVTIRKTPRAPATASAPRSVNSAK